MKKHLLFFACAILLSQVNFAQTELIQNGDFSLPDDQVKYKFMTDVVDNWRSEDLIEDHNGREYTDVAGDGVLNPIGYCNNSASSVYQIVGEVPSAASSYAISFSASIAWDASAGDEVTFTIKLSAFSGDDPVKRVIIDSANFVLTDPQKTWNPYEGNIAIPANSAFAGQNLVVEYDVTQSVVNPADNNIWVNVDDISVIQTIRTSADIKHYDALKMFPVPAKDQLNLFSQNSIEKVSLFDVTGREIRNCKVLGNSAQINIAGIHSGLYFVNIKFIDGTSQSRKINIE
jgi:hypothetical protein